MRKQFEELHPLFDLEKDAQGEYTCVLTRVTWLGFELGKKTNQADVDHLREMNQRYIGKMQEQQDQIAELKSQIEMTLIGLNHLKENIVIHRNHGNEHTALRDFNDLLKITESIEADLQVEAEQALRGEHE